MASWTGPAIAWLRGDHADRARYADMHGRFADAWLFGALIGGTSLLTAWWAGWPLVALVVLAAVVMQGGIALHRRAGDGAEVVGAVAFGLLEVDLAASVLLSGGSGSPLLPLLVVPVFTQAVCFRPQVIWSSVGFSMALAVAAVLGAAQLGPAPTTTPSWVHLVSYGALLLSLALAGQYLAASDLTSRGAAVVDPLTGLFNRSALTTRFADVQAQAAALGTPVAVVMCDVDHFKRVNDTHGHRRGDDVLQALAGTLRATLRTSDLIYRVGGEEVLVLLPGHDLPAAAAVAERLRQAVAATPMSGLDVTISAGVAAARGADVDLAGLSGRADGALYLAKRAGRDRVREAA
jgi:diguanylate cyclase (GGDEF)-like protein